MRDNARYILAVDIGATKTRIAVTDKNRVLYKRVYRTPRDIEEFKKKLRENIIGLARDAGVNLNSILAVSVASIGPLDVSRGIVENTPNLGGLTVDLRSELESLGKPFFIVNDCVAAVWGEYVYRYRERYENIVYVTISSGIGGGIIVDGNLLLGKKGNAHEIGHIVVDAERKMSCGCGGRGHWEAYGGGYNIPRFAQYLVEEFFSSEIEENKVLSLAKKGRLDSKTLYREARVGDKYARAIVNEINKYHVAGFESVINLYDPEVLIVGGSIALNNWDLVMKPVVSRLLKSRGLITRIPKIVSASFGEDEVLIGASAVAYRPPETLLRKLSYLHQ